ncbi:uncharacterized protein NPIL_548221 [Nephila pilipes]|uniref:YLPM1-like spectrin repeat domain-containing protein n=1 Tax=Nephila pilipes TaxID=299642 RepID=A0A8X6PT20_NEPPI|nr:uncharacterized protein NPIL_548221 [Nephila pilipes]
MYQAWSWGGTSAAAASPTAAGYVQPAATGQVAATQWPTNYNQYAAVTPEMQQQWAAAWASQAQYAYGGTVPVAGQVPTTTTNAFSGFPPDSQSQSTENTAQTPSDKPKNSSDELAPKDNTELEKLKQLKEQAEQWKTLQQPAAAATTQWPYTTATSVTSSGDALKSNEKTNASQSNTEQQNQLDQDEEEFERQFKEWEKQFQAWKEENINHPDKEAFRQYEKQWQEWRAQLLQRKEQMQKDKAAKAAQQSGSVTSANLNLNTNTVPVTATSSVVDTTAVANASLYYQQAQYMYMQPYVYPGTVPVAPPTVPQQYPYTGPTAPAPLDGYMGQPPASSAPGQQMNLPNSNINARDMKGFEQDSEQLKYGQSGENFSHQEDSYANFEEYGSSNMYPPNMDVSWMHS